MTRTCLALVGALLLAACAEEKPVDMTAHYARQVAGGPITVKASAGGDVRVEAGDAVFLRSGGTDYVVLRDAAGPLAARLEDALAVLGATAKRGAVLPGPRVQPEYAVAKGGAETVAGVAGAVWRIHPRDVPSLPAAEVVVSEDSALAVVGKGLAMQARYAITLNSGIAGGPGNLEKRMIELYDKGTVLRFGDVVRLERLDRAPIAPAEFAVPQPVLDGAALERRLAAPAG